MTPKEQRALNRRAWKIFNNAARQDRQGFSELMNMVRDVLLNIGLRALVVWLLSQAGITPWGAQ